MLSCVAFFFPTYTKKYVRGSVDVTGERQSQMQRSIKMYMDMYQELEWFRRGVIIRFYYDDSLFLYVNEVGVKPWIDIISKMKTHPLFQMVHYDCKIPYMRETFMIRDEDGNLNKHDLHRGLLGTMIRFHALMDSENSLDVSCVCLIDIDTLYTAEWWKEHLRFIDSDNDPKEYKIPSDVLAFTSLTEFVLHGYVYPESWKKCLPFVKGGLTSVRRRMPIEIWDSMLNRIELARPLLRYMDALRLILYGPDSNTERSYEDFGYGFDEAILNMIMTEYFDSKDIHVVSMRRESKGIIDSTMLKLNKFMQWAGSRSIPVLELSDRMFPVKQIGGWRKTKGERHIIKKTNMQTSNVNPVCNWLHDIHDQIKSIQDLETMVFSKLRPHMDLLERMQIDGRLLSLICYGIEPDKMTVSHQYIKTI